MKFESPLQLRNKILQLADKQIFGFTHFDGFTQRMLSIEMIVDQDYDYELYLKSADRLTNSKVNYDNRFFEFTLKGHLPVEIEDMVEELVLTKRLSRQISSPTPTELWTDMPVQLYLFKNGVDQVEVEMPYQADVDDFTSEVEKTFLKLHNTLPVWIEKTYNFLAANS